jgi:hypothetical protein
LKHHSLRDLKHFCYICFRTLHNDVVNNPDYSYIMAFIFCRNILSNVYSVLKKRWNISVSKMTGYGLEDPGAFPSKDKDICLSSLYPNGSVAQPAFYPAADRRLSLWVKRPKNKTERLSLSND